MVRRDDLAPVRSSPGTLYDDHHISLWSYFYTAASSSAGTSSPPMPALTRRRAGQTLGRYVAPGDGPLVVLLGQHGADEAGDGSAVGKLPTTSVHRRSSLLSRRSRQAKMSPPASTSMVAASAKLPSSCSTRGVLGPHLLGAELFEDGVPRWPPSGWEALGTLVNRFLLKCVLHRGQDAPGSTTAMACAGARGTRRSPAARRPGDGESGWPVDLAANRTDAAQAVLGGPRFRRGPHYSGTRGAPITGHAERLSPWQTRQSFGIATALQLSDDCAVVTGSIESEV
jgi:hypothetical protein